MWNVLDTGGRSQRNMRGLSDANRPKRCLMNHLQLLKVKP